MAKARAGCKAALGVPHPDDDELMSRYQREHDRRALEQLFLRHRHVLLRFITRLVGEAAAAEDAFQQCWLKVIEAARKGSYAARPDAAFRTWLFTLARNHVVDEHRRKLVSGRNVTLPEVTDSDPITDVDDDRIAIDPAEEAIQHDLAQRILSAVQLLPCAQREVITLWAEGFGAQEIAVMLGAPRETVLSRKKYALAKLRISAFAVTPMAEAQNRRQA